MSKVELIVHDGTFHFDDLASVALLELLLPDNKISVTRTRDKELIKKADWVIDVGGEYNHESRRYDHHQPSSPTRHNGVPYAALGLLWRHWGATISGSDQVANLIDQEIIQMLDGPDNGFATIESLVPEGKVVDLGILSWLWSPNFNDEPNYDERFFELLPFVKLIIQNIIRKYQAKVLADKEFAVAYDSASDKRFVTINPGVSPLSFDNYPEVLWLISQSQTNDTWKAKCVTSGETFDCRKSFPKSWCGLSGESLQKNTNIIDSEFVHRSGFLAVAKTKEAVLQMCELALVKQ